MPSRVSPSTGAPVKRASPERLQLEQGGNLFRKPLGDHDRREVREPRGPIGDDRCVDNAQPLGAADASRRIDHGAFVRPRAH